MFHEVCMQSYLFYFFLDFQNIAVCTNHIGIIPAAGPVHGRQFVLMRVVVVDYRLHAVPIALNVVEVTPQIAVFCYCLVGGLEGIYVI